MKYNKNMVLTCVKLPFITFFIVGDQISSVNGTPVWNRRQFDREYVKAKQAENPDNVTDRFYVIRTFLKFFSQLR